MKNLIRSLTRTSSDWTPAILRLLLALIFFPHGAQKLLGWFGGYGFTGTMGYFTAMGIPYVFGVLAIVAEIGGAIVLLAGLGTRLAALGIAANMLVAALMVHRHFGFFVNWFGNQKGEGIEYHLLAIGIALTLAVYGAGRYSVDRLISQRIHA